MFSQQPAQKSSVPAKKKHQKPKRHKPHKSKRKRSSLAGSNQQHNNHNNHNNKKQKLGVTIDVSKADHDVILQSLRTIGWHDARNTSRRNVIRETDPETPKTKQGRPYCQSFIFGRNMKDPQGGMSWWSTEYPNQYKDLCTLISKYAPEFSYTHITLNRNLRCKRHQDKGNLGPSFIAGFGPFVGGALIVEQEGGGNEKVYGVKSKLVSFNGATQAHETKPYTGERFTVVYYTSTIKPSGGSGSGSGGGGSGGSSGSGSGSGGTIKPSSGVSSKFQMMKQKILQARDSRKKKRKK
tara:strand:- start:132 stop:1016 length:885 start_codon:yes stop_codon:yes gene_type:complete